MGGWGVDDATKSMLTIMKRVKELELGGNKMLLSREEHEGGEGSRSKNSRTSKSKNSRTSKSKSKSKSKKRSKAKEETTPADRLAELLRDDATLREYYTAMIGSDSTVVRASQTSLAEVLKKGMGGAGGGGGGGDESWLGMGESSFSLPSLFSGFPGMSDLAGEPWMGMGGGGGLDLEDFGPADVPHYEDDSDSDGEGGGGGSVGSGEWDEVIVAGHMAGGDRRGRRERGRGRRGRDARGTVVDQATRLNSAQMRAMLRDTRDLEGNWEEERLVDAVYRRPMTGWEDVGYTANQFASTPRNRYPLPSRLGTLLAASLPLEPYSGPTLQFVFNQTDSPASDQSSGGGGGGGGGEESEEVLFEMHWDGGGGGWSDGSDGLGGVGMGWDGWG